MPEAGQDRLVFRYTARDLATGRLRHGEQAGESAPAVRASLRRIGYRVQAIEPVARSTGRIPWLEPLRTLLRQRQRRLHRLAKADLCDGLSTLLQAGIPLDQALTVLAASPSRRVIERRMMTAVRDQVRHGVPFGEACLGEQEWFDRFDVALLAAGQHAGDLAGALTSISQFHHRSASLSQRLIIALAYPAILAVAGVAAVEFVSFVTLPQLVALITQAKHAPPLLTVILMRTGQGLATWWPVLVSGILLLAYGLRRLIAAIPHDSRLGRWWEGNLVARLRSRTRVAFVALSLSRLRRAGLPLADAVTVVADTVEELALAQVLRRAVEAIRRGEDLSAVADGSGLLDPEFAQLLQLGERSGELTSMLERIAERYQRAADRASERLSAVLGPLAIILLALLIGVVVMACVLPIMQLGDLV